jgi:hypothetical protein
MPEHALPMLEAGQEGKMTMEEQSNRLPPDLRYMRDADFHQLVDYLTSLIMKAEYTPTELREAVILSASHYEYTKYRERV